MKCEPSHRMVWYSINHENRHFPTMAVPYLRVLRASFSYQAKIAGPSTTIISTISAMIQTTSTIRSKFSR